LGARQYPEDEDGNPETEPPSPNALADPILKESTKTLLRTAHLLAVWYLLPECVLRASVALSSVSASSSMPTVGNGNAILSAQLQPQTQLPQSSSAAVAVGDTELIKEIFGRIRRTCEGIGRAMGDTTTNGSSSAMGPGSVEYWIEGWDMGGKVVLEWVECVSGLVEALEIGKKPPIATEQGGLELNQTSMDKAQRLVKSIPRLLKAVKALFSQPPVEIGVLFALDDDLADDPPSSAHTRRRTVNRDSAKRRATIEVMSSEIVRLGDRVGNLLAHISQAQSTTGTTGTGGAIRYPALPKADLAASASVHRGGVVSSAVTKMHVRNLALGSWARTIAAAEA
jgi:hypothetical protein